VDEPSKFILRYRCESSSELGFHLNVTTSISKHQDDPTSVESFDLEIEMRYIGENLKKIVLNSGIIYKSRLFRQNDKYYIKDYISKVSGDEPESGFSMQIKHSLIKTNPPTSPDSNIHIEIIPNQWQS
jgi:hypothetical protein